MSDTTANETTDETGDDENAFEVEKCYFGPDELATAGEYLNQVAANYDKISRNFDPEKDFPAGYGLSIVPISKRTNEGNVTIGVAVAAIPDPTTVAEHEKGGDFIRQAVLDSFMAKVANSVRPRADGSTAGTMPFSVEDFIERRGGGASLKAYTEIAPTFVKALRQKGLKFITASMLRQVLQSKAFAEAQFEKIAQNVWEKILDSMVQHASKKGLDPAVLVNWRETRDQVEVPEMDELDLEDLGDLV